MARFAIGIDLGTTNSALSFAELPIRSENATPALSTLPIVQLLDVSEIGAQLLLPSFVYLPAEHETPALEESCKRLPWHPPGDRIVGEAARRMGGRITGRLATSAKSWLCNGEVDRRAAILPWGADASVPRISPVTASGHYLSHLKEAWNAARGGLEAERLERQHVVLTVPASFDETARELTVEAAKLAGIERFTLLEEPQAAFYHWMHAAGASAFERLPVGSVCVVVDCGGGTTDFSLIAVVERNGVAEFERLAVGDHLLLGGDNMDLAIARHVEQAIAGDRRLDVAQWSNLVQSCRRVKEAMLATDPPEKLAVAVMGRGSRIVGGSMSTELRGSTVRQLVLDGFFPTVGFGEEPLRADRVGLQEFGLPYVADPAVTRHLAAFLRRHSETIRRIAHDGADRPHAVLFNGGVFNAAACRQQVVHVLKSWFGATYQPLVLPNHELELAVARGAAFAGWLKATGGRRIKGGAARSYYIGVADRPLPSQEISPAAAVVCLVPHGLQEGESVRVDKPAFEIRIGEPVAFPLYSSTARTRDKAGDLFTVDPSQLAAHPSLTTVLRGGKRAGAKRIPVRLEAKLTEIGTLELHCAARDGSNRWKLQFQARNPATAAAAPTDDGKQDEATSTQSATPSGLQENWSQAELAAAVNELRATYAHPETASSQAAVQLPKRLEAALDLPRSHWTKSLLRSLWDPIVEVAGHRKRTIEHEWRWYNLAGHVLRPGWGDPIDPFRVEQLWKLVHQGVAATKSDRVWSEYWVMCRRVAGGLDANRQSELGRRIAQVVGLNNKKTPRRVGANELAEAWRAAAACERLEVDFKVQFGEVLVKQLGKSPLGGYVLWSLTRFGARTLLHGPANLVIGRDVVAAWLRILMQLQPSTENTRRERDFAIAQIARATGDRVRDIDDDLRMRVADWLEGENAARRLVLTVREPTPLDAEEEAALLGDAIPPGLIVVQSD